MAHTYTQNLIHLVFSTKQRLPLIANEKQPELWKYIVGVGANHKIHVLSVGGMHDHVHVLFDLPKTITLADAVRTIKANSSRWMRETNRRFGWQEAYGAFVNQAEHHKKRSFEEEYVSLLKKHNLPFDRQYLFG